jgi:hypothetical protein
MRLFIQMSQDEELKALPILLRHSPGMMLRSGTYAVSVDAARTLRQNGVTFVELGREATSRGLGA